MTSAKLDDARRVISAAERKAKDIGQPMNIAVADEGGNIVAHVRMDDAWIGSIDIAMTKAFTIGRRILRRSRFERRQNHDFCRRHPAEA
jgi:uncharacterized protein GlcG (DUF336 family)